MTKDYMVAPNEKYIQVFVEPKVHKIKEVLNVTQMPERREVLEKIIKPLDAENKVRVREYPLNPVKYVNQPVIAPVVEKENLQLQYVQGQDYV